VVVDRLLANVRVTEEGEASVGVVLDLWRPVAYEVAETPETQTRGLMERPALAPNAGMLFIFPDVAPRAFWMMHTLIPLDMLFIDADGRIINIQANAPPCEPPRQCPTYHSTAAAKYVLEIAGGRAQALGIRAGDQLHF